MFLCFWRTGALPVFLYSASSLIAYWRERCSPGIERPPLPISDAPSVLTLEREIQRSEESRHNYQRGRDMKIAVVGATGATGRRVVRHALAQGHIVTAVARHPERLSPA